MMDPSNPAGSRTRSARAQIELLRLAEGFFGSRVLFSLNRLGVFEAIGAGTVSYDTIAARCGTDPAALIRLLRAGTTLGLLESADGESFRIADEHVALLADPGSDSYLGNWIAFLEYLESSLDRLDRAAAGEPMAAFFEQEAAPDLRTFTLAMHDYAALRGREIVDYLDCSDCESLLDVGCGPGTYAFHLGMRYPDLELYLLDVPEVLEVAAEVQKRYPLRNRIHYLAHDLEHDVAGTWDLVLVSNTLHMLGESASRRLLSRLYDNVAPGGSLVVQAQYLDDDRLGGRWPVFMDLAQLCVTRHGRNHTVAETRAWLEEAGFVAIEYCAMSVYNTNGFLRAYRRAAPGPRNALTAVEDTTADTPPPERDFHG